MIVGVGSTITREVVSLYGRGGVTVGTLNGVDNMGPSAVCDVLGAGDRGPNIMALRGVYSNLRVSVQSFFSIRLFSSVRRRVVWGQATYNYQQSIAWTCSCHPT